MMIVVTLLQKTAERGLQSADCDRCSLITAVEQRDVRSCDDHRLYQFLIVAIALEDCKAANRLIDRDDRCCDKEHGVRVCIRNGGAHSAKGKKRCCGASAIVVAGEQPTRKASVPGERTRQTTGCVDAADTSYRIKRALKQRRRYDVDLVDHCRAVLLYSSRMI
jgi:hypothetical protein